MDWTPYLVGGATRPDAISGLDPRFAASVWDMLQAAAADGVDLRITSAYRSPEVQAALYNAAPPERRGKYVAAPGRSMHGRGVAVDFAGADGGLLRDPNSIEAQWLAANTDRFNLVIPMDWEPWQVEMAGARGQGNSGVDFTPPRNALGTPNIQGVNGGRNALADMEQAKRDKFNALASMIPRYETPRANAFRIEVV